MYGRGRNCFNWITTDDRHLLRACPLIISLLLVNYGVIRSTRGSNTKKPATGGGSIVSGPRCRWWICYDSIISAGSRRIGRCPPRTRRRREERGLRGREGHCSLQLKRPWEDYR